ncbi:MAG TPA: metallophosphoesterase [Armatimonadota bacterium]|jgi:2',3'-cyclic-nucleotide 2'-phosphodiesterase (5'-nucleotidase family)
MLRRAFGLLLAAVALAPLARAEDDVVLTILHTNDMHGRVLSSKDMDSDGPGGLARAAAIARTVRRTMPHVLFVDAGDITHGTPVELMTAGESEMRAMSAAGYDVATLGNHEFDWGQDATAANIARAAFPFVTANVHDRSTGGPFGGARESVIFQEGPVKVAVFGLTTLETPEIEWPPAISRVRFDDPIEAARRVVPELRKQADVVICLSHLGVEIDPDLAKVPGIDVIIGGHSHTRLAKHMRVGNTLIAQTGALAAALGRMDLLLRRTDAGWTVASVNGDGGKWWADEPSPPLGKVYPKEVLLPLPTTARQDRAVTRAYRPFWNSAQKRLKTRLGTAEQDIPGSAKTESPLPLVFGDLLRDRVGADVVIAPGDSGPMVAAGPVTLRTVYENIGGYTRQNVVMVRAKGADLRAAVERAYRKPGSYGCYFSGVAGRIVRGPDGVAWEDATVNGQPLQDDTAYMVAGVSYLIMDSPSLMKCPVVSDTLGQQKTLISEAIVARETLAPAAPTLLLPPPPPAQKKG